MKSLEKIVIELAKSGADEVAAYWHGRSASPEEIADYATENRAELEVRAREIYSYVREDVEMDQAQDAPW